MLILVILFIGAISLYLLFWPVPVKPIKWTPPKAPILEGAFATNEALSIVELLPVGGRGPEDIIFDERGRLFTGLEDGRILRISPDGHEIKTILNTGGRPLGLAMDARGNLIIADADKGLLSVDPQGQLKILTDALDERKLVFTNHLDVAADGTIYFSESSDRFPLHDYKSDVLESRPNGRLMAYDPESGKTRLVLDNLYFANGVAVSSDQSYLLVAENDRYRIQRFWLEGPKAGQAEIFIENLPGFPDNLHNNGQDIFWLTFTSPRKSIVDDLAGRPFVRKIIYRLPEFMKPSPDQYGFGLGLDGDGRVLHNLQDPNGVIGETSCAVEHEGMLYVGRFEGEGIGRLPVPTEAT